MLYQTVGSGDNTFFFVVSLLVRKTMKSRIYHRPLSKGLTVLLDNIGLLENFIILRLFIKMLNCSFVVFLIQHVLKDVSYPLWQLHLLLYSFMNYYA